MKSIILLSGGVDSAVALAAAKEQTRVELALSFNYGQTHRRELQSAAAIAKHYGVEHHELNISQVLDIPCPLTGCGTIPERHAARPDASFVPGRNLVMLSIATAWAQAWDFGAVVIGANADDKAGYPDCRPSFIHLLDETTREGYRVAVWAPLLQMTKKDIVTLGKQLNVPLDRTWSCYRGGSVPCGRCGACESRKEGGL